MNYRTIRRPNFFYTTAPLPCPYLPGRTERKVVTELSGPDAEALHDQLSRAGFRRSHNIAYAPVCQNCNACVPIRIPVDHFAMDKGLRRIARANAVLQARTVPAHASIEQYQLFQRYQQMRHAEGDMATMSFYDYRAMVEDTPIDTFITEFRDPAQRLLGCCLVDRLADGLSAVYSFYESDSLFKSLGSHAILHLIDQARAEALPYVYLGYWVRESRKMAYKTRFRPYEILAGGAWQRVTGEDEPAAAGELAPGFSKGGTAPPLASEGPAAAPLPPGLRGAGEG
ncbi:arginyltransferase [Acidisoma sp. C75]